LRTHVAVAVAIAIAVAVVIAVGLRRDGGGLATEDLDVASRALDSAGGGLSYASQCRANDVPLPRPWGRTTLGDGVDQWKARGTLDDSYIGPLPVDVYTLTSTSPPGVCAIALRADGTFDVLCQGTNGKACFWEADPNFWPKHGLPPPRPRLPNGGAAEPADLAIVGVIPAAPDQSVPCTQCHAGENAFITHTTAGHPTNQRALAGWRPSTIYTPIVPKEWPPNTVALSTRELPRSCLGGCHDLGGPAGAGRLPRLRGIDVHFCDLLKTVTSIPASRGGMPPGVADCTPTVDCPLDVDADVKRMVASCGAPPS
jgi:hypothetical protein